MQADLRKCARSPAGVTFELALRAQPFENAHKRMASEIEIPTESATGAEAEVAPAETPPAPVISQRQARALTVAAIVVPAVLFLIAPPLSASGLWDPHELNVAEFSRRIAVSLFGATKLSLEGADNHLPYLNDLGRPSLPFLSIAGGFKLFGLSEWAGRLPLAVWGIAGVVATYAWVSRLIDRRAGLYAALALSTMPLYAVHARTLLGDVCMMSAFSMAFGGLLVAVIDHRKGENQNAVARLAFGVLGIGGLLAGYYSRGALLGVAAPVLAVGAAALVCTFAQSHVEQRVERLSLLIVGASFVTISVAIIVKAFAVVEAGGADKNLSMWLGAMVRTNGHYPTFDYYVGVLGHALAPWSAFVPFALGRLFLALAGVTGEVATRESKTRVAIILGASVALACHGLLAPRVELMAFIAPSVLAAACGIAIRDFERGAPSAIPVGVGTLLLAAVFYSDFDKLPEKAFQGFALSVSTFPDSFKAPSHTLWRVVLGSFAAVAFIVWLEREPKREPFARENYLVPIRAVSSALDGWLSVIYFALVAASALAAAGLWIGARQKYAFVSQVPFAYRPYLMNVWWALALLPFALIAGVIGASDLLHWNSKHGLGPVLRSRGALFAIFGSVAATILSSIYYPALANQLSPKDVFRSYEKYGGKSGSLGLLGIGNRAAAYYAGGQVTNLATPEAAHAWLNAGGSTRRFVAMRGEELAKLNKLYRDTSMPRQNLPVLDARSSQVLLASSMLITGETNANPLSPWLFADQPAIAKPLKVNLEDKLEVLGYDMVDLKDNKVDYLTMGKPTRIRFYFRVLEPIDRDWEAFIHIDRDALRYNGDHKPMQGKYPMTYWLKGDIVVDDHKVELGPNFSSGKYKLYFGFFPGGDAPRMKVVSGPSDGDNRVFGGEVRIQ